MNEEADYAEMLEIPVSTVNVVKKKSRKKDVKEKVIDKVNSHAEESDTAQPSRSAESEIISSELTKPHFSPLVIAEFAAAAALCLTIFLTNVFMENSALNTFVDSVFAPAAVQEDDRKYSDFTLSGVVSDYSKAEVATSSTGVLSFTAETAVYPVCDGKIEAVTNTNGVYTVTIGHSKSFKSVITGLSGVYYAEGTELKGNLPFAYSDGTKKVEVTLYDDETPLNCFSITDGNDISWKS